MRLVLSWILAMTLFVPTGLWAQQEALLLTIKKEVEKPRPPNRNNASEPDAAALGELIEIYQQEAEINPENIEEGYEAPAEVPAE